MVLCPSKVVWSTQGRPGPEYLKRGFDLKLACFSFFTFFENAVYFSLNMILNTLFLE